MYRRFFILGSVLVVVLLTANVLRLMVPNTKGQSLHSNEITPYTVVLAETVTDANGVSHFGMQLTQAVRKDGSIMKRFGKAETGGREINLAQGERIVTVPQKRMKTTMPLKPNGDLISQALDPRTQCTQDLAGRAWADSIKVLGEEYISGYRTVKIVVNESTTKWLALDVGCAPVRYVMDFGNEGKSETNLVLLVKGEPDSTLFTVPKDYIEVKPSVGFCGGECSNDKLRLQSKMSLRLQRLDEEYLKSKPR